MSRKFGAFNPASTVSTINTVISTSLTGFYASFDSDANDEGPNSLTATLDGHSSGTASISTSDKQYGAGSLNIDDGDFVTYSTGLSLGEGNFTVQFWLYLDEASSGSEYLVTNFDLSTTRGWYINLFPNNSNSLSFSWNDGDYRHFYINSSILTTGQWEHIAYVYDASAHSMEIYLDGVAQTVTNYNISSSIGSSARNVKKLQIADADGAGSPSRSFNGRMDDLRITRTKEYTSNFTPPSAALGAGIATPTTDTRSHSHVWNYPDIYKARRADTWPSLPVSTRTIQIHVAGGGGGGGGQAVGGDGGDGGVVSVQKTGVAVGTILTYVVGGGGKGGFYGAGRSSGQVIGITSGPMAGGGALVASDGDFSSSVNQSGAEGGAGSGVFLTTATQANAIVIAGGGGGGAGNNNAEGGAGGGQGTASDSSLVGQDGQGGANQGEGGQSTRGGRHGNGTSPRTTAGALLGQTNIYGGSGYTSAGGGGGGYYGGGGGGHSDGAGGMGGAGGGSGYVSSEWTRIASTLSLPAGGAHATTGADGANGKVVIIVDGSTAVSVTSTGTTATYEVV